MSRVRDIADNSAVFADGITTADITEGSNLFFTMNVQADDFSSIFSISRLIFTQIFFYKKCVSLCYLEVF